MIATRLKLTNLRVIEAAEFRFQPDVNLIVGVNGVGKTSVLDALRVCLSSVVKQTNKLRHRVESFSVEDIRIGTDMLTVECGVRLGDREHSYIVHKPRESSVPQKKAGMPREQVHRTPEQRRFVGELPLPFAGSKFRGRPLAVLFSTNRAVPNNKAPATAIAAGGIPGAFARAYAKRELQLGEFAAWMKAQEALRSERPTMARVLAACEDAVERLLPGYRNLSQYGRKSPKLCIDRDGTTIPVHLLSDGERGILALVLDLTRRLAQANPELSAPACEAEAVVLIDEIELHLHPTWQRQIVRKLTETFPRCQFIVTTHSPQVIGEVEHNRIHIMVDREVYSPAYSYGVDSSRVLEEIMDADPRTREVRMMLSEVSDSIARQRYDHARVCLTKLVDRLGENDPEVTRISTLLDFLEGVE